MDQESKTDKPLTKAHLWEIVALRDLAIVLAVVVALVLLYWLRPLLVPILIAFALAYVAEPVFRFLQSRLNVPRGLSAAASLVVIGVLLTAAASWLLPELIEQAASLYRRLPEYARSLGAGEFVDAWVAESGADTGSPDKVEDGGDLARMVADQADLDTVSRGLVSGAGRLFGFVGTVVGTTIYLLVAGVLIAILFVFFSARFASVSNLREWIPEDRRDRYWELARGVDRIFSAYVRGQFIVAVFTTAGFCIGFSLIGVPYWFVVSLIGGVLSLIPYGQMSGWLLAIALSLAEVRSGSVSFSWFPMVIGPTLVYAVTQSVETFVITPWVQGESVDLHPVLVMLVILAGGMLAGVIGIILAVPLTATVRLLFEELLRPKVEEKLEEA